MILTAVYAIRGSHDLTGSFSRLNCMVAHSRLERFVIDFLSVYELYDVQHCLRPGSLDLTRVTTQSIVLVMLQANWTDARIRVLSEDLFCYMIASRIFILFARTAMSTFGVQASLTRCSHSFQYVTGTGQARPVLGLIKLHAVQLRIVYLIPCSQLLFA